MRRALRAGHRASRPSPPRSDVSRWWRSPLAALFGASVHMATSCGAAEGPPIEWARHDLQCPAPRFVATDDGWRARGCGRELSYRCIPLFNSRGRPAGCSYQRPARPIARAADIQASQDLGGARCAPVAATPELASVACASVAPHVAHLTRCGDAALVIAFDSVGYPQALGDASVCAQRVALQVGQNVELAGAAVTLTLAPSQ
jgi:hypothetical protein